MRYIYALSDPRTALIRYVGKADDVDRRVSNHLCPANLLKTRHVCRWLASLTTAKLEPAVSILQELGDSEDWEAAERNWIALLREQGYDLTNATDGGEGGATYGRLGKTNSEEHRKRISVSKTGKKIKVASQEVLDKRAESLKAHWAQVRASGGKKYQPPLPALQKKRMALGQIKRSGWTLKQWAARKKKPLTAKEEDVSSQPPSA